MKTMCTLALLLCASLLAHGQKSFLVGDAADATPSPSGGILLAGGGSDNDDGMAWFLSRANGGDVVVLRAAGTDAYNDYLYNLGSVNSVETLVIGSVREANKAWVETQIRNAEAVFIAGGDQADYVNFWKGTAVESALDYVINTKGGVVGGTSAGCAIQGEVYFSAINGTTRSEDVLADPYNSNATLGNGDFLSHSQLANTITDTHFDNPDRRGRIFGFMARMVQDYGMVAQGIGVEEYTAVAIEPNGNARVFGDLGFEDYAYFLKAEGGSPEVLSAGSPLSWDNNAQAVQVYKIRGDAAGSNTFDLNTWTGTGGTSEYFYACTGSFLATGCSDGGGDPGNGGGGDYCASSGNAADEWIEYVDFRNLYNVSGSDGGYGDYTNLGTDVERGQGYGLYVRPGFSGSDYTEDIKAWIDWNGDGDFDDADELVLDATSRRGRTVSTTVSIPANAALGATRMRVTLSYDANPESCGTIRLGEVEDYTINVVGAGARGSVIAGARDVLSFQVYPNPATDAITFDLGEHTGGTIQVINLMGQVVKQIPVETGILQKSLSVVGLPAGQYVVSFVGSHTRTTLPLQIK